MKCPECVENGQTSKLYTNGNSSTLLGWTSPYYDEDGQYHSHNPNTVTSYYSCSKGHQITRKAWFSATSSLLQPASAMTIMVANSFQPVGSQFPACSPHDCSARTVVSTKIGGRKHQ
jgi:hypothetical protein